MNPVPAASQVGAGIGPWPWRSVRGYRLLRLGPAIGAGLGRAFFFTYQRCCREWTGDYHGDAIASVGMVPLDKLAESLCCLEAVDKNTFQRRARILQALWREQQGFPIGEFRGRKIGSHLAMPWAEETLANFLDGDIRRVVQDVLDDGGDSDKRVIERARLFSNLLSSQPMAFNLFGHLHLDLALASNVLGEVSGGRVHRVTAVEFEFSPGRGEQRYTGDHSAFDVYVRFTTPTGESGFAGIEVKYHENLADPPARHRPRYDEVAALMGCFQPAATPRLTSKPLQQIWRDHLLVGAHRLVDQFADGFFALVSPCLNEACNRAVAGYRTCLVSEDTFSHWSLESIVSVLRRHSHAPWIDAFADRYLAFDKIDRTIGDCPPRSGPRNGVRQP